MVKPAAQAAQAGRVARVAQVRRQGLRSVEQRAAKAARVEPAQAQAAQVEIQARPQQLQHHPKLFRTNLSLFGSMITVCDHALFCAFQCVARSWRGKHRI